MSILSKIFASQQNNAAKTTQTTQPAGDGCVKCGKLVFNYDAYFQEYICENCGWMITEKPKGKIQIIEINTGSNTENSADEGKEKSVPQSMSVEEMNKVIQEYGRAMVHNAPPSGGVADVSMLPYPKSKIQEALIQALRINDGSEIVSSLKGAYTKLSAWQEDVGEQSIGIDLAEFGKISDPDEQREAYLKLESQLEKWKETVNSDREALKDDLEKLGL